MPLLLLLFTLYEAEWRSSPLMLLPRTLSRSEFKDAFLVRPCGLFSLLLCCRIGDGVVLRDKESDLADPKGEEVNPAAAAASIAFFLLALMIISFGADSMFRIVVEVDRAIDAIAPPRPVDAASSTIPVTPSVTPSGSPLGTPLGTPLLRPFQVDL
jgi:hypothetical protein